MEINTEKITEAEIIPDSQPDNETTDLLARLSKVTEKKLPGADPEVKTETKKSFWDSSDDDFEKPEVKPEKIPEKENKPDHAGEKPLTDASFHNSAENATFFIDFTTQGLCKAALNKKFKSRFTKDEKEAIDKGLPDANRNTLNDVQKLLFDKYETLTEKKETAYKRLPFDDDEKNIMEDAFFRYFKQKNKELPPEYAIIMALFTSVGRRVVDVSLD